MADLVSGYNIIEKIGTGARSQIFQVVKPSTGQIFALKRVVREPHEDTRFLDQATIEYEVSSKVDHPYLRRSFEIKRIRTWMRLTEVQVVMEYVNGVSLEKRRPERMDESVDIFLKLAEGLHALHQTGSLHADIKPNNILLTADGGLKIIDFGQSCQIGFRKPRIQGTPDYIAPEQVERRSLNQQTDVFNLGATLYWVLTGQTYPTMITREGRMGREGAYGRVPPSPQELNPEVPTVLSRLVMESCSYRRSDRPRDMKQVVSRLEMAHHVLVKRRRGGHEMATSPTPPAKPPSAPTLRPGAGKTDDGIDFSSFLEIGGEGSADKDAPGGGRS